MRKLNVTPITNSAQMPVKKGTLQFLQDAYTEVMRAILVATAGAGYDENAMYAVYGLTNAGTPPIYTINEGAIFYQGELYFVDLATFTAGSGEVAVIGSIVQTQYSVDADPVLFTDGTPRNVHDIRKMNIVAGAAGSGLGNYADLKRITLNIPQLNLSSPTAGIITGSYPNISVNIKPAPKDTIWMFCGDVTANFSGAGLGTTPDWIGWALADGRNSTKDLRGRVMIALTNADSADHGYSNDVKNVAAYNTIGNFGGEEEHTLTVAEMPSHTHPQQINVNGSATGNADSHATNDKATINTGSTGGDEAHNNLQPYYVMAFVQKL